MSTTLELLRNAASSMAKDEMETDPVPDEILNMCKVRTGKLFTVRDKKALEAAMPGLRVTIKKEYRTRIGSGTNITWHANPRKYVPELGEHTDDIEGAALIRSGVPSGYSSSSYIRISGNTTHATWPTPEALQTDHYNTRYFALKAARNAERLESLAALEAHSVALSQLAQTIDCIKLMAQEYAGHLESLPDEVQRVARTMMKGVIETLGGVILG